MALLNWGKPKIEVVALVNNELPASPVWIEVKPIVENTTKLATTKGNKLEAKEEGGGTIDTRYGKNSYVLEFEMYEVKGATKPIEDEDGLITTNYAIRLTPEDTTCKGKLIERASVSVEDSWSSEKGSTLKYSFEALKPTTGKMVKDYTPA